MEKQGNSDFNMKVDYLIVGQGLAGTTLAFHLLKSNKKIFILDDCDSTSSSRVAAGLFNPITGKRNVKTWKADILFPYMKNFYRELEDFLGIKFLSARKTESSACRW